MWTRSLLKENGKIAFHRNYWPCVAVSVLTMLLWGEMGGFTSVEFPIEFSFDVNTPYEVWNYITPSILWFASMMMLLISAIGACFAILISNVISVGCKRYFMENREHKTEVGQLFYGFQKHRYSSIVWIMFFRGLFIFLWSLLFIIPGIVKSYAYRMIPYLLAENPELDRRRAFEISQNMMMGHKMEAFVLDLSFIGWGILGGITLGISNIFFARPYQNATYAEYYAAIKADARMRGVFQDWELPGFRNQGTTDRENDKNEESEHNIEES